ncbi:unnamed protein product [Blepharisma stoltei]|uniref:TNFR-Cys domain-containing protein n=1 Tax=Blepharisma stoltei TaxID=1481888 RepID=A0AAU9JKQ2_9CILI|nr:unnamed protein product [Blepharisma stoltei]
MRHTLIYFAKILLAYSTCFPYNSFNYSGACWCNKDFYLAESKVCVDGCPSLFIDNSDGATGFYSCKAPSGDTAILFTLEFSKVQDLSATYISNSVNSAEQFNNLNSYPYNSTGQLPPLPTLDRGFYFAKTSSATSNQNHVPALYFTINIWIKPKPLVYGEILNAINSSTQYLRFYANSSGAYILALEIYDSSNNRVTATWTYSINYTSYWQQLSVVLQQTTCSDVVGTFYLNGGTGSSASLTSTEVRFKSALSYSWILGSANGLDSFTGFIYWLQVRFDTTQYSPTMSIYIECLSSQYWNGSSCQNCGSSCSSWPWCVRGTDCSICYTSDCGSCSGYSLSMCTVCTTGILPGCCDIFGTTCTQTWSNTACFNGKVLIGGVCLYATPYGLENSTTVSTQVITADFTGPFAGVYGSAWITGNSSSSYNYWNSPEVADPFPAKNRGLYFNYDQYLSGEIALSHTWTISMWVYPMGGIMISHSSNNFYIDYAGTMTFTLEKWDGTTMTNTLSRSISSSWAFISFSVEFANKVTTIKGYIDNISGTPSTNQNYVFRLPVGMLYLGKGSTGFKGYIAYFVLWQAAISDFSAFFSISTLTNGSVVVLWPCDYLYYFDGSSNLNCLSSCTSGCINGSSCNLCGDPLCSCTSFSSGACTSCVANASGSPCACLTGYYLNVTGLQQSCSPCYTGCSNCTSSSYNSCTSCNSGYYLYNNTLCLLNCPGGYFGDYNQRKCLFVSNIEFNATFYDKIELGQVECFKVGSDSANKYPNYDSGDPYPAYLRGYYFNGTTYLSTSMLTGPYFSVSVWVNIITAGTIISRILNGNEIFCLEFLSGTLSPKLSLMLSDNSVLSTAISSSILSNSWNFVAFTGKVDTGGTYTINSYYNAVSSTPATSSSLAFYQDLATGTLYIGTKSTLTSGFSGFLYSICLFNTETLYSYDFITSGCTSPCTQCSKDFNCFDTCSLTTFRDGSSCTSCLGTGNCKGCRFTDTCGLCKTKQCYDCTSFSGNCNSCIANAGSDGYGGCQCNASYYWEASTTTCEACDVLCQNCVQGSSFECEACYFEKITVGSICLNDCPYGYDPSCSPVSSAVIDQMFDSEFSGSYGDFITGTSSSTYQPFNSPEAYDPIPAYKRGLYFNGSMNLTSSTSIYLSYGFSMGLWFYAVTNGDLLEKQSKLKVGSVGSVWLTVESTKQVAEGHILSTSTFTGWTYFSFTVNYESGTSSLDLYLNGNFAGGTIFANKIFRDQASTYMQIGKSSSSGFTGFIYYFQLWNVPLSSFSTIFNSFSFCGSGQGSSCLWACDISAFKNESTSSCSNCNSCSNGCVRANDCNLCDDQLCSVCGGFDPGKCSTCVPNASPSLNGCACNSDYQKSNDGLSCVKCAAGCKNCSGNGFYQCTSCLSGWFFLDIQCLESCPTGYTQNSTTNNCDYSGSAVSLNFSNLIVLDTLWWWNVGSEVNSYPIYDANDPYPAYLRGYYFLPGKYLTNSVTLPPSFSISIWIQPIGDGYIIGKYMAGNTWYVKIIETSGNPKLSLTLLDKQTTLSNKVSTNILNSGWVFISFDCAINSNGITTITSYLNGNQQIQTSTSDNSLYLLDSPSDVYIGDGSMSGSTMPGFTGFLWKFTIYPQNNNALTDFQNTGCLSSCTICPADLSCPDNCPISEYFDGTSCAACIASADKGCRSSSFSRLCRAKECATCTEFTGDNSCIDCITNASKDSIGECTCNSDAFWVSESETCEFCDALCSTCLQTAYFECSACKMNYQLVGSICLNGCPYGFEAPCVSVSTPVINLSFNSGFQGSYGILNAGTNSSSFSPFNSPETVDPIPAYQRGLYFNGDMYLLSSVPVLLSHSFTVGAWLYSIVSNDWLEKQTQKLTFSTQGTVNVQMEDPMQVINLKTLNSATPLFEWNYLAITFEYVYGVTTIKICLNNECFIENPFSNAVFRDLTSSNLMIGKSSNSGFTGFISSFTLWNIPITDLSSIINDFVCGTGQGSNCLISCDLSKYWDGSTCTACNSCSTGCVRAGTCNICNDPLCSICTGFGSGACTQCAGNASGAPNACVCNGGYWLHSLACIPCENFLNQTSVSAGFDSSYSKIQFNFTIPANASPKCCSCLFDAQTLQSFGSGYTCSYATDYSSLTVYLGQGYTISKESIAFLSGFLKNSDLVCGNPPTNFSVPISLPSPIPSPSFTFSAPKTLSILCETLKLTAVIGNDLPYEQFKWTFSSAPANAAISAYSTQYSNTYSDITIPKSSLFDSIIFASFAAKNNFGTEISVSQSINVTSSLFLTINFNTLESTYISRLKSFSISISSIQACTISSSISVTWSIGLVTNNITSIDEVSLRGNQTSQNVLIIPPKVLPASTNITFIFRAKDLVYLSEGEASVMVQTDVSDPVILFNRTDGPAGVSQDLLIDAGSSYDPDGKSQLSFEWLCVYNAADCSTFISNPLSSLMKISANSLSSGITYNFTLILTKTTLNPISTTIKVSKSIYITSQQGTVPSVNIVEIGNSNVGIVNPDLAYRVQAQGSFTSILWSAKGDLPILFSSPLIYADLVIAQNSLLAGSKYTLEALINQNFVFTWTFYVNQGPKGGSLSVTPSSGYEMTTQFSIEALNWVDPEDNIPIQYAFGYTISDIYQVISSKNTSSLIYSTFPYSSKQIMISVDVYDSLLSKVTTFQGITVSYQADANVDQYVDDVKSQLNSPDLNPISIPKLVSDLSSLSLNRNYIVNGDYSTVDQQIQDSYNIAIDKISSYTQNTDPYDPNTYTTVFSMLKVITSNPSINSYDNIAKVADIIKEVVSSLDGKVQLDDTQVQTFIGICNNNFQVNSSSVSNQTDSISSIEGNIKSVGSALLNGMSSRESKLFLDEKISVELSKQPNSVLSNFSSEIMGASITLASNTESFISNDYVGTSFVLYDPIPGGANASFSLVSFTLTDLSTHDAIPLNNTSYNYISIPVEFINNSSNATLNCSYLEEGLSKWKTDGCVLDSFNTTVIICKCSHLSIFSAFFGGAASTAQSSNIGDTVNVNAFSSIDWDTNAIGLYFCAALLIFYIVLTMLACKLDKKEAEEELDIIKGAAAAEDISKKPDELTERSEDMTYRTDDSIAHNFRHKIGYDPTIHSTEQNTSQEMSRADSIASIQVENIDVKPTKKRMSFFEFVGKNHDFISIFLPDSQFSHSVRVTAYTVSLLGNMFFIGLFYQDGEQKDDDSDSMNFSEAINNYSFRDFWVMVYSTGIMIPIAIILRILAKRNIKEYKDPKKQNKIKKREKWKKFGFFMLSWSLMGYFCWSIILFSIQFQLSLTYKWICNTSVSYGSDIFVMPFVKMPIKVFFVWLFTKLTMALGFSSSKDKK